MKVFVDSDVLIWHLRGRREALECLMALQDSPSCELWTGAWQKVEISFHSRQEEIQEIETLLRLLRIAPIDADLVDDAARLFRK
jgi:hypothetical protein